MAEATIMGKKMFKYAPSGSENKKVEQHCSEVRFSNLFPQPLFWFLALNS